MDGSKNILQFHNPCFPQTENRAMRLACRHHFEGFCMHAIAINNRIEEF